MYIYFTFEINFYFRIKYSIFHYPLFFFLLYITTKSTTWDLLEILIFNKELKKTSEM